MRKGFACLFSGTPGTGKTETAYQIARETGRNKWFNAVIKVAVAIGDDANKDQCIHLANFYMSVYRNFLDEGLEKGELQLREILPKITLKGSGDDVSVAGIIRKISCFRICA